MKRIRLLMTGLLLCLTAGFISAQNITVTGTVTDASTGEPIPYASIQIKGTMLGTSTGDLGKYELSAPSNGVLVFSFVGYETIEIPVNGRAVINHALVPDAIALEDVMVVAYQTVKKTSYTGSAAVVDKEKINKIQAANFTGALQGTVAGVQVTAANGQPGASATIRIRGVGSVNASNAPLYVVDGAAFNGDINSIATDDIEGISVLKDATASALYGARGANGVIMITTKRGSQSGPVVNAKVNIGVSQRAIPEYDRVEPGEFVELMWEAYRNRLTGGDQSKNSAANPTANANLVAQLGGYNPFNVPNDQLVIDGKLNPNAKLMYYDDWYDELSQLGVRQDYNVSLSGGLGETQYYASFGYLNQQGHVRWSDYERFTGRVNVTSKITNWLKVNANISGAMSDQSGFLAEGSYTTNPFYYARMMGPIYPVYQRDENFNIKTDGGEKLYDIGDRAKSNQYAWAGHLRPYAPNSNLVLTLPLDYRGNSRNTLSARTSADIKFLKDFNLQVGVSTDIVNTYYTTYQNHLYGDAESVGGRSTKEYYKTFSYTFNQILTYNKMFGDHSLNVLAAHENYQYNNWDLSATRTGFKVPTTELVAASIAEGSSSYSNTHTIESYFGQVAYSYASKYNLSFGIRTDGTSRFSKEHRWGTFWSLGGAWRISQEDFLKPVSWIDELKLKASYGEQGNENVNAYYAYQSLFTINDWNNNNYNGAWYSQLVNNELQWEKNANLNVGVEFAFFNRLRGGVEFYHRQSNNLLFNVPIPESSGISSKLQNIGTMKNYGIEVDLSADVIKTRDFRWTLDLNLTTWANKITKLPLDSDGEYQEIVSGTKKLVVGGSIYDFWLREYAGVDPANGNALYWKTVESDEDGNWTKRETVTDPSLADYYFVGGSSIPDFFGGLTTTFAYKGFDLSVLVNYSVGGKMYDSNYATLMHYGNNYGTHYAKDILNRWTPENTNTDVPRLQNGNTWLGAASSRWLIDASYLSLRNVTLGYSLPQAAIKKMGIRGLRIYATGDNLFLLSARKGMDPQQSMAGTTDFTYVPARIISLGVNFTF